jgi:5-methylcytosine-specific restriction protein A
MRPSATQRGYDYRWRVRAKRFLRLNPLCAMCAKRGRTTVATCVDHVVPHKGDQGLFWSEANWQGLCSSCHSSGKQGTERRGYDSTPGPDGYPTDPNHPFNKSQGRGGG